MESKAENVTSEAANQRKIEELKAALQRAQTAAIESAKAADQAIREHPYPSVGLAFAVGVLIGVLLGRR